MLVRLGRRWRHVASPYLWPKSCGRGNGQAMSINSLSKGSGAPRPCAKQSEEKWCKDRPQDSDRPELLNGISLRPTIIKYEFGFGSLIFSTSKFILQIFLDSQTTYLSFSRNGEVVPGSVATPWAQRLWRPWRLGRKREVFGPRFQGKSKKKTRKKPKPKLNPCKKNTLMIIINLLFIYPTSSRCPGCWTSTPCVVFPLAPAPWATPLEAWRSASSCRCRRRTWGGTCLSLWSRWCFWLFFW